MRGIHRNDGKLSVKLMAAVNSGKKITPSVADGKTSPEVAEMLKEQLETLHDFIEVGELQLEEREALTAKSPPEDQLSLVYCIMSS